MSSYGIRAFDTSAYYGPSEIVLGNILDILKTEFPRSAYQLVGLSRSYRPISSFLGKMTKCGRYGVASFDYSPATIRASVKQSLERLKTNYLDVVYLHDVEFVCTPYAPKAMGNHASALHDDATSYGLSEGDEGLVRGKGDQLVLDAFAELRKLQEEGLIRHIGITGIFSFQTFYHKLRLSTC